MLPTEIQIIMDVNEKNTVVLGRDGRRLSHALTVDYSYGRIELHGNFYFDPELFVENDLGSDASNSADQIADT